MALVSVVVATRFSDNFFFFFFFLYIYIFFIYFFSRVSGGARSVCSCARARVRSRSLSLLRGGLCLCRLCFTVLFFLSLSPASFKSLWPHATASCAIFSWPACPWRRPCVLHLLHPPDHHHLSPPRFSAGWPTIVSLSLSLSLSLPLSHPRQNDGH